MNKVVEALKAVGVFYVATVDGDIPRVRPFSSVTEYEGHVYLCCGNFKEVYRQLSANPQVELCGMYAGGTEWLRVSAMAVEDDRIEVQRAMLDDPTGPAQLYEAGDGRFVTYRLQAVHAVRYSFFAPPQNIEE